LFEPPNPLRIQWEPPCAQWSGGSLIIQAQKSRPYHKNIGSFAKWSSFLVGKNRDQECCQVGRVRGDDDEGEEPPEAGDRPARHGSAGEVQKWSIFLTGLFINDVIF